MKRPLFAIGGAFAIATWLAFLFSPRDALLLSGAFLSTAVLLLVTRRSALRLPCLLLLSGALALGCYALHQQREVAPFSGLEGQTVEIQGIVLDRSTYGRGTNYTLRVEFLSRPELPRGRLVLLRSYSEDMLDVGEEIRCLMKVTNDNPQGLYQRSRGFALLGQQTGIIRPAAQTPFPLDRFLVRLRGLLHGKLQGNLAGEELQLVGAVVLGLQGDVSGALYAAVNRAGTAHLLAVSGLHLSVLTAALLGVLGRMGVPRVPRSLLTIAVALLFAGLVGFPASIMRAFVMCALTLLAGLLSRRADGLNSLGLALLLLCLFRPYWVLGKGLWLSAASTMGILIFSPRLTPLFHSYVRIKNRWAAAFLRSALTAVSLSLCAYITSLPVLALTTGWLSLASPLANLLIAPFVLPLLLGGIACSLFSPGTFAAGLAAAVTGFCATMVAEVSRVMARLATFSLDEGYLLLVLLAAVAMAVVLFRFGGGRHLVVYALLLLVLPLSAGRLSLGWAQQEQVQLVALEGGVDLLLRDGQVVLLGSPRKENIDRLLRYLEYRGAQEISAVIAMDFPGGVDSGLLRLRERYPVGCVVGPDDAFVLSQLELALPDTPVLPGGYGETTVLGGLRIYTSANTQRLILRSENRIVLKNDGEYAIITGPVHSGLYPGAHGMLFSPGLAPVFEPLGQQLFGEIRVLLPA